MRYARATWRGPVPGERRAGMTRPALGLVLHIQQGTEAGTDSWFHNPASEVSAHFGIPQSGRLVQWVDTDDEAWAEVAGNSRWFSAELEGYSGRAPAPTASQISELAHLVRFLHLHERVKLQISNHPATPGIGWHGMGGAAWGDHLDCPGDRVKAARQQIIVEAKSLIRTKAAD